MRTPGKLSRRTEQVTRTKQGKTSAGLLTKRKPHELKKMKADRGKTGPNVQSIYSPLPLFGLLFKSMPYFSLRPQHIHSFISINVSRFWHLCVHSATNSQFEILLYEDQLWSAPAGCTVPQPHIWIEQILPRIITVAVISCSDGDHNHIHAHINMHFHVLVHMCTHLRFLYTICI